MITLTTFELFYLEVLTPHGIAKFQISRSDTSISLWLVLGQIHRKINQKLSIQVDGLVKFVYQCRRLLLSGGEARTRLIKIWVAELFGQPNHIKTFSFLFVIQILNFGKEDLVQ